MYKNMKNADMICYNLLTDIPAKKNKEHKFSLF